MTETIQIQNIPFFTDGNVTFTIRLPVKVDESGEWLSADQADTLEALYTWAKYLVTSSNRVKRPKRFIQHVKHVDWAPPLVFGGSSPDVTGLNLTSIRVGMVA